MSATQDLLLITADMNLAAKIDDALKTPGASSFSVYMALSMHAAQKDLAVKNFDAVIAEIDSVKQTGIQFINTVQKTRPECAIILIGEEFLDEGKTLEAIRMGAQYCAARSSFRAEKLISSLKTALARQRFINDTIKKYRHGAAALAETELLTALNYGVRTTLTSIAGMGELLLKTRLNDEQKEYADIISKSCSQLLKSLNDALNGFDTRREKTSPALSDGPVRKPAPSNAVTEQRAAWGTDFTVLVTEDNLFNQKLILSFLAKKGVVSIETALNGRECVEIYRRKKFSVVIMDCQMPVMDGLDAARAIREYEKGAGLTRVPIIALTADTLEGTREKCLACGMDDYLTKPIDFERLYNILARIASGGKSAAADPVQPTACADGNGHVISQEPIFDTKPIKDLKKFQVPGKPDIIDQLFGIYLSETAVKIENLKKAVAEKNIEAIKHIAHNLKSSTANVGGIRLSALFKTLELKAKANDLHDLDSTLTEVEKNYGLLEEKLKQFLELKERP